MSHAPSPETPKPPLPGPVEIGTGAARALPRGGGIWRVRDGEAEIYLATPNGRHLIAVIAEGGAVFALPPEAGADLVAVGDAGARLEPAADLMTGAGDGLVDAVEGWITAVAAALDPHFPDASLLRVAPGDDVAENTWLRAGHGVVWITAEAIRYSGADSNLAFRAAPLAGRLVAAVAGGERAMSSADLMRGEILLPALVAFNASLPDHVAAVSTAADRAAIATLTGEATDRAGGENDARRTVEAVARALGIEITAPLPSGVVDFAAIPGMMTRAGLRARRVTLSPGWSRRDIGPLIAEEAETRAPVALLWQAGRYHLPDGAAIGPGEEEAFGSFGYVAHAPLPDKVKGLASLAMHLLPALRRDGMLAGAAGAGASLVGVLVPMATGWVLSDIVPASMATLLFAVGLGLVAGAFVSTVFSAARSLALLRITGRTGTDVSAAVADKILRLPPTFFRGYSAGDLNQRIDAIDQLRQLVTAVMMSAGLTLIFSVFYFVTLLAFDARLAGLALVLVAIYVLATLLARSLQMAHVRRAAELDGKISGASFETLSAIGKLRVAAAEERALSRWLKLYRAEREASIAMGRIGTHFSAFSDAYQTVTLTALFGVAAVLQREDLPAGHFIGFLVAFGAFQGAFIGFCDGLMSLFTAAPMAARAKPIFEAEAETSIGRTDPGRLSGAIELSGVVFSYPGARTLLDGLDLDIRPGEHIAIVGGSGSGKSTILRLLLGFETPERGAITYDGRELSRLDLGRVRAQIGVVMQTSRLFAGSIYENIRGASEAGLEECMSAAEHAGLGADLATFPMGLHTPLTEGTGALSGGQKQRILIARALVGSPAIQFFDEATSALDNATQAMVMRTLDASSATRVTIAHRLSTVRRADRICVLKNGRFAEIGTYDELMALDGAFAALARRQLLEE
ncbi:ATP-binding cassette domain-containing protein [Rhodobacteraceae bacterium NNCM2]|nr:ATP-binding cassette domain-containing protein [Coraliihabitans acroporae]